MSNIDRFGIGDADNPIFTKAPTKTRDELEEATKDVERMKKMMGITSVNET